MLTKRDINEIFACLTQAANDTNDYDVISQVNKILSDAKRRKIYKKSPQKRREEMNYILLDLTEIEPIRISLLEKTLFLLNEIRRK